MATSRSGAYKQLAVSSCLGLVAAARLRLWGWLSLILASSHGGSHEVCPIGKPGSAWPSDFWLWQSWAAVEAKQEAVLQNYCSRWYWDGTQLLFPRFPPYFPIPPLLLAAAQGTAEVFFFFPKALLFNWLWVVRCELGAWLGHTASPCNFSHFALSTQLQAAFLRAAPRSWSSGLLAFVLPGEDATSWI